LGSVRESVLKKPVVSPSFSKVWGSERLFLLRCSLSGVVSLPGFGKVEGTKKRELFWGFSFFRFQLPSLDFWEKDLSDSSYYLPFKSS
jgi:hypothetical protein